MNIFYQFFGLYFIFNNFPLYNFVLHLQVYFCYHKYPNKISKTGKRICLGSRTIYRTLSLKRTPFQTGIDRWPHLWKVLRRRLISHTYPMWLWDFSLLKISSPGPVFMEPSDYYDVPINKVLYFSQSVGLIKG
jgi:hypothetical protein